MNVVMLVGRLTQDPELRTTNTGKSVASFSIAVNKRGQAQPGQPDAEFINIVAWNRQAEVICQYLKKGRQIALRGHLQTRNYVGNDGLKRYVTEVVLDEFDFIGSKNDSSGGNYSNNGGNYNNGSGYNNNYQAQPQTQQSNTQDMPLEIDDDFSLMADDDDVPF